MLLKESATDTIVVYMILKRLIKPWKDWEAHKMGLIDEKGKKLKSPETREERRAWTVLDRFIYNFKRVLEKFVGSSKLGSILSAAFLLKESYKQLLSMQAAEVIEKEEEEYLKDFTHAENERFWKLLKSLPLKEDKEIYFEPNERFALKLDKYRMKVIEELNYKDAEELLNG